MRGRDWGRPREGRVVRRFAYTAIVSISTFALVLAGATSAMGKPSDGVGPCSSTCGVGADGQGGTSSGGNAQGGYFKAPTTRFPGSVVRFAGTEDSGLLELSGATEGSASGHVHDSGELTGRTRGDEFGGDCTGHCSF
jgi:hypothetical protein